MMGIVNNTGKKTTQNLKIANKCMRHDMTATLKPLSLNMGYRISSKFVETQVQIQCATATYLSVGRIGMYGLLDMYKSMEENFIIMQTVLKVNKMSNEKRTG